MKIASKIAGFAMALILSVFSCHKENHEPKEPELLILGTWTLTRITVDPPLDYQGNGQARVDLTPVWPACIKDDRLTFAPQNRLLFEEGATKCVQTNPQTITGFWDFNTFKTHVSFSYGDVTQSWEIQSLTDQELVGRYESRAYPGHTFTVVFGRR